MEDGRVTVPQAQTAGCQQALEVDFRPVWVEVPQPALVVACRLGLAEVCPQDQGEDCLLDQVVDYRLVPVEDFRPVQVVACLQALVVGFRLALAVVSQLVPRPTTVTFHHGTSTYGS